MGGAPRPQQAPPVIRQHAPAPAASDRRQTGGAQDGANGAAPSEAGLGRARARTRAGRSLPPSLPAPPRRTDPLAADRAAPDAHGRPATPTARVYAGGARRRRQMAGCHQTGRGQRGTAEWPPLPPPPPPPPESAQGPFLPPPEGACRGRTVLCYEGQAPSPVVHPGHPAPPALSLPKVRALTALPYPLRVLGTVPMCEGTSSGLHLDAGAAALGSPECC